MEIVRVRLPYKPTVIAPIGDIQWNGQKHEIALNTLQAHIDRAVSLNAYFIGMGDYIDFASPSNRARLSAADLYDGPLQTLDDAALRLMSQVEEILAPTRGRWLGLLEGHHFYQLQSGQTTDMKLAERLKTRHLGTAAYVQLAFEVKGAINQTYTIWATHGHGGGQKSYAPIAKLENLAPYWQADLFLIGHMTKVASAPINRCYPVFHTADDQGRARHRKIYLVGTGGWSKGYQEQSRQGQVPRGGYVERKVLNPVCLGAPLIFIHPKQGSGNQDRWSIDHRVEV